MRSNTRLAALAALALVMVMAYPGTSAAQRFRGRRTVIVGGYFGYPFFGAYYPFYDPFFFGAYPWYPYYYRQAYYPPPWRDRDDRERTVGIRLEISPKQAQVYVDGYFSGTASDFDGIFKRLRVPQGQHELVLYLKGYQTIRQTLDLRAGQDYRIRQKLAPLAAGETSEPPPAPKTPPPSATEDQPGAQAPEPANPPEPGRRLPRPPRPPRAARAEARGFGALAIRVQPAGADVLIDGDRWQGPDGAGPLVVQVSEGSHRVEVRKDGYVSFSTDVQVRDGETTPLNVSLPERR